MARMPTGRLVLLAAMVAYGCGGAAPNAKGAKSAPVVASCSESAKPASSTARLSCRDTWRTLDGAHELGESCMEFTGESYVEADARKLCDRREANVAADGCKRSDARKGRCLHHCGQSIEFVESFFFDDDAVKVACGNTDGVWIE